MKEKDVIISIKSAQTGEDESDAYEFVTNGKYKYEDTSCEFTYMESELTGLEGTKTTFHVDDRQVLLTREGTVNSQMLFENGQKHYFLYDTPYGSATMGVRTHNIKSGLNEHGGEIEFSYAVDVDSVTLGKNDFRINIREA